LTRRIASLGMYDRAEVWWANDLLWSALAERLIAAGLADVPRRLDRTRPPAAIWPDPDLLFAQCCGYPLMTEYRTRLRYVATPCYAVPGCAESRYRSRIVVRRDDPAEALSALRGRRAALNDRQSNSGMNLFRAAVAPLADGAPFFAAVVETGSHAASMQAVADGAADVAAIDTVSFAHQQRHAPATTARLRTIGWTEATAGLPFVTAATTSDADLARLRAALDAVVRDPALAGARDALFLDGVRIVPDRQHQRILALERRAVRRAYPELA
jgi:ABC-type phosphate/phosphonate transport system substrate-binding protein